MRSWAMLVESTRSSSCEVRESAFAKNGTIAAKTMLAMMTVTSSSIMLKPRAKPVGGAERLPSRDDCVESACAHLRCCQAMKAHATVLSPAIAAPPATGVPVAGEPL